MTARELVEQYIAGWREGDAAKIVETLADSCEIIESNGSTYRGIAEVESWVREWNRAGSTVDQWIITSIRVAGNAVFFEWNFACTVNGKKHAFLGATVAEISDGRITTLREYRMTKSPQP